MEITLNTLALCLTALDSETVHAAEMIEDDELTDEEKGSLAAYVEQLIEAVEEVASAYETARIAENSDLPTAEEILNANTIDDTEDGDTEENA